MTDTLGKALTLFDDFQTMLADPVRMEAWSAAIRASVRPGDVVLDMGAGTGILGFLALQAGAGRLICVEKSEAIELARRVAAHNGWLDRVEFHHASSIDVEVEQRADVLISETLGSFGVEENTLPFTIDARERLCVPDVRMVPCRLELFVAPASAPHIHERRIEFWRNVGGVDMSPAIEDVNRRMAVEHVRAEDLVAPPALFGTVDLRTVTSAEQSSRMQFRFPAPTTVHGLAGWFRADLGNNITVDTAPDQPLTHWKQAWFPVEPVDVVAGDVMRMDLSVEAHGPRSDNTRIRYDWQCTQIAGS